MKDFLVWKNFTMSMTKFDYNSGLLITYPLLASLFFFKKKEVEGSD